MDNPINLPKISVIITVLNKVTMLEKALLSVFDQQYPNLECIVIDGGSTDGTVEIIKKYSSQIDYWISEPDKGAAHASNKGIRVAQGTLLTFLMADDWYEPGILLKVGTTYCENPNFDIYTCAGDEISINNAGEHVIQHSYNTAHQLDLNLNNLLFHNFCLCFRFFHHSVFDKLGLFEAEDKNGKYCFSNDRRFLLKATLSGVRNIFIPYLGYHYLVHADSATFGKNRKIIKRCLYEHRDIALDFLPTKRLSFKQKILFQYWYHDQTARAIVYELLDKNFKQASSLLLNVLKYNPVLLPLSIAITALRLFKTNLKK